MGVVLRFDPEFGVPRAWLALSLVSLVLAGGFALLVVIGRTPPFDLLVTDPLFFKRCLVAHVNLALVTWFYSFLAALLYLLPGRNRRSVPARASLWLAGSGIGMLLAGAASGAPPVLANYIPTLDGRLFQLGQLLFAAGLVASLLDPGLLRVRAPAAGGRELPESAQIVLRAAACALLLALLSFALAALRQPAGLPADLYWERVVWGGGHVLQLVCSLAMVAIWLILLTPVLGRSPLSSRATAWLCVALLLPWTLAPVLALQDPASSASRDGFTTLMRWCIFPGVSVFLLLCARALVQEFRAGRVRPRELVELRVAAFWVSGGLTLLGYALGAAIRGSNTMVPAHYHASVGAVTVAFMAATFPMLATLGLAPPTARLRRAVAWQPLIYGGGMLVFASGFALAGAHGMGRKIYGAEQAARGFGETIGLTLMGAGGLLAIAGGLRFLGVVAVLWRRGVESEDQTLSLLEKSTWRWSLGDQKPG
jgi:hypothetical protein